jgi:cytochrome c oxidase subunit 2
VFEEDDKETGYAVFIAVTLAIVVSLFVIALAIGNAVGLAGRKPAAVKAAAPAQAAAAPATAGASAPATANAPAAATMTKLYFDLGKAELPADAATLLSPLIAAAKGATNSKLVISGFHDASGDPLKNAELAKQRAFAVRDALKAAGIGEAQIELEKPAVTTGGADAREARRVEVTLR